MEKEKQNVIKFEMSNYCKFFLFRFCYLAQWVTGIIFIIFIVHGIRAKYDLSYLLTNTFTICGVMYALDLIAIWKIRHARFASELIISLAEKKFSLYVHDIQKVVDFSINDILEVNTSSDMVRFILKDSDWVTWIREKASDQILQEIIKSSGVPIVNKKLW